MDEMLAVFWLFSGIIVVGNVLVRLCCPEPIGRSYVILPPILSPAGNGLDAADGGRFEAMQNTAEPALLAAQGD